MHSILKNAIVFAFIYLLTSCSNDFLNENISTVYSPTGLSNINISPDWQSSNYYFKLSSVKEVDYEIVSKPSWLNIASLSGHLSDSIAIVQCSATKYSDFTAAGIYIDFLTVRANEKNFKVPVSYITEGNPKLQVQSNLSLSVNMYGYPSLPIRNDGLGVLLWEIMSMPDWLALDSTQIGFEGVYITPYNTFEIPLKFKIDKVYTGDLAGKIVLNTNDKDHSIVTINVTADLGTPILNANTDLINFSFTDTSKIFYFGNYGNGSLVWEFFDIPEWLTITPSSGICSSTTSSGDIVFICDRTKLSPGPNSVSVILRTNDSSNPSYSIRVTAIAPGVSDNIRAVEGNIMDAVFNKNLNTLYFVTSSPNKLITYDVIGKAVLNEISLSKAPTSFAITEDWTKAAVGHNGYISSIDLSSNTVTANYAVDYSVNDISWAESDWFSYTQNGDSFSSLHWINTADGTSYNDPDGYSLDGNSIVKKVPNQPFLIATRNGTSPSGFFAYDIATKSKKSYSHMGLTNFWFSENGDFVFAKDLNVYRTTSSTGSTDKFDADINAIGKINTGSDDYYGLQYLYHSNNYVWVLQNDSYFSDSPTNIFQIEDNDYTLVKKYEYDWFYQPNAQTTPFNLSANYIFVNNEGTEITILCKGVSNNSWVMQFIDVK